VKRLIGCAAGLVFLSGCGYTAGAILPNNIQTLYVETFKNNINPDTSESFQLHPGIEIDVTNDVIGRYVFDGNLRIVRKRDADAILTGEVIDFLKDPIKYAANNEDVDKYRLTILVNIKLVDQRNEEVLFTENGFAGDTLYFTTGSRAKSEATAVTEAIADLAKNIVDRTIESW